MSLPEKMIKTYRGDRRSREKIAAVQRKRLVSLVKYARENSPFYRELYAGLGDDFSLADLPPVSKPELMARFDDVLTDRGIRVPEDVLVASGDDTPWCSKFGYRITTLSTMSEEIAARAFEILNAGGIHHEKIIPDLIERDSSHR